jgi:hypothetical protein
MFTRPDHSRALAVLALAGALGLTGCAKPAGEAAAAQPKGTDRLQPHYDESGKLQKLEYDRNSDGKVDTWGYMDGARVVKVEVDENADGTVDRWEYHRTDAGEVTPPQSSDPMDPSVERIERATRFDGKVSRREYFANGVLSRTEEDTDGDGRLDKWETYTNGSLSLMALDTQKHGTPDRRLVYAADGSLDRIEADLSGSGNFQPLKP